MGHGEYKKLHSRSKPFILNNLGGYIASQNTSDSWEGFHWGGPFVWGMQEGNGQFHADNQCQSIMDYTEVIIPCGCDPETTNWGFLSQWKTQMEMWYHRMGKKHIFISPELNWYGTAMSQQPTAMSPKTGKPQWDKWIPAYPNTEAAMWQAIAYIWLTEGTYEKDYVAKYCVEFDKVDQTVKPATTAVNTVTSGTAVATSTVINNGTPAPKWMSFVDMIMGKEDGVPKTPEWAAPLCGVPSRIIKALAHQWAAQPTAVFHNNSGAYVRGPYSHEAPRFECFLLAMQGVGLKPGVLLHKMMDEEASHGAIFSTKDEFSFPNGMIIGNMSSAGRSSGSGGAQSQGISRAYIPYALMGKKFDWFSNSGVNGMLNVHNAFPGGTTGQPPRGNYGTSTTGLAPAAKMIWDSMGNWITGCAQTGNEWWQAVRTPGMIEFNCCNQIWFENNAQFADLVLPVQTLAENIDMGYTGYEAILTIWYQGYCIDPVGESKSDFDITLAVAQTLDAGILPGLGLANKFTGVDSAGKPLTIDAMCKQGFDKCGLVELAAKGLPAGFPYPIPTWDQFKAAQYWCIPVDPTWKQRPLCGVWAAFMANPNDPKNYIDTPSGKIEFYSHQWEAAHPNMPIMGQDADYDHPAVPHWGVKPYPPYGFFHGNPQIGSTHEWEWFRQEENPRAKVYPIILETGKPKWRQHTMNQGIAWTNEISMNGDGFGHKIKAADGYWYEPCWINPVDARPRNIKTGDVLMLYNERGATMAAARVTERMRPGTVYQEHGSYSEPIGLPSDPSKLGQYVDRGGATNIIGPTHGNSENARHSGCWTAFLIQVVKADMAALQAQYPAAFKRIQDPAFGPMTKNWVTTSGLAWPQGSRTSGG